MRPSYPPVFIRLYANLYGVQRLFAKYATKKSTLRVPDSGFKTKMILLEQPCH